MNGYSSRDNSSKQSYLIVHSFKQTYTFDICFILSYPFQVMMYFNVKDRDRDGRISYDEFCGRETLNERAFKAMDLNSDGFVSKAEMLQASLKGSRRLSAADVEACFKEFDKDKDDKLNYDEFCLMMNINRRKSEDDGGEEQEDEEAEDEDRK